MNGNVSMKIVRVKISDAGKYKCFLPSIQKEASIQLNVVESDVIVSHNPVKVVVGNDAILQCHLETMLDMTTLIVAGKCNGKDVHLYRSRKDDLVNQGKNFKDRTSLFHDEMTRGNISLKLKNVTELDAGSYNCYVPKLPSQVRSGYVTLTVGGDTGIGPGAITGIVIGIAAATIILAAGFAILWKYGLICTSAGREKRGSKRENMEGRPENRPETVPLSNMNS